jgi:hypothetical protein
VADERILRKVASWREYQPPRQWFATLECGHGARPDYDECPMEDADKGAVERAGGLVWCIPCSRQAEKISKLEAELTAEKASLARKGSPSGGEGSEKK